MQHTNKKANKTEVIAFLSDMMRDENCTETNRLKAADMLIKLLTRTKSNSNRSEETREKIELEILYVGSDNDFASGEI